MIHPGTDQAIVQMHLALYSNTTRIIESELHHDRQAQIERLHRIYELLYWNRNEIGTVNKALTTPTSYYRMFNKEQEGRDRLFLLHHQRSRINRIWNQQLDRMKM